MIRFQITYKSTFCRQWPKLRVRNNKALITEIECRGDKFEFEIGPVASNKITLDWFNKTERHTESNLKGIINDQTFEILNVRADGIQIEDWFWTDGYYVPRYFEGFMKQHKEQRKNEPLSQKIKSQLLWHFPGTFEFPEFTSDFWGWYFDIKQKKEVIKFLDKDPDRIHKFRGSLDPCEELVGHIKKYL